ncbi:MAG: hypothetical protein GXP62_17625, partial [Oligoflexia bacterium]|nr:hypothetical protein [Oligoflexia bacterium]
MTRLSRRALAGWVLSVGLGLGAGLGWLAGSGQHMETEPPLSVAGTAKTNSDRARLDPSPPQHAPEGVKDRRDPATQHLSQRLELCERLLSTQIRPKPHIDLVPADQSEAELPQAWSSAVAMAMEHCGLAGGPDVTDCAQFPCLALTRPSEDPAATLACMRTELKGSGLDELHTYNLEIDCGGGVTDPVQVVFALDSNSDAYQALDDGDSIDSFF